MIIKAGLKSRYYVLANKEFLSLNSPEIGSPPLATWFSILKTTELTAQQKTQQKI